MHAMLEFLRENLLCSADDSPKRDIHQNSQRGGPALCCNGTGGRMRRRRPGEIISSQGSPVTAAGAVPSSLPWDSQQRGGGRGGSPLRRGREGGSPVNSFRHVPSFQSALGGSFACSGAAMDDRGMPGQGLYVSMQRGLGPRGNPPASAGGRGNQGGRAASSNSPPRMRSRASSLVRTSLAPALSYEANQEDPIDSAVEQHARQLPVNCGRALLLRRIAPNEYEVDGFRVTIGWRGNELCAFPPRGGGDPDEPVKRGGEPLQSYLMRVADRALARSMMQAQVGQSFESREGISGQQLQHALQKAAAGQQQRGPQGGSFLCRTNDGGSFIIGRDGYNSQGGSFYSANVYPPGNQPSHAPPMDHKIEAMRKANVIPMQVPTPMQGGGMYRSADPRPQHQASTPGGGAGTPTMPGTPLGSRGLQGLPPRQGSLIYAPPNYVAVSGG